VLQIGIRASEPTAHSDFLSVRTRSNTMAEENQARSLVDTITRDQLTVEALQAHSAHQTDWNNTTTTQIQNLQTDMLKLQRNQEEMKLHFETQFQRIQDMISGIPGFNARGKEKEMFPPLVTQPLSLEGGETSGKEIMKPISVRLDFPLFDGEDPETWCCRAEEFFGYYNIPAEQRLSISAFHMVGEANLWFRELRSSKMVIDWEGLVRSIHAKYSVHEKLEDLALIHFFDPNEEEKKDVDPQHTIIPEPAPIGATNHILILEPDQAGNPYQTEITATYELIPKLQTSDSIVEMPFSNWGVPSVLLSLSSTKDAVDVALFKHRWRWKRVKKEGDVVAEGEAPTCRCRRSRAGQRSGGREIGLGADNLDQHHHQSLSLAHIAACT